MIFSWIERLHSHIETETKIKLNTSSQQWGILDNERKLDPATFHGWNAGLAVNSY